MGAGRGGEENSLDKLEQTNQGQEDGRIGRDLRTFNLAMLAK